MQVKDKLEKATHLSSICDELRSTAEQRDQELQSISELLEGIKKLQAAQQDVRRLAGGL